MDGLLLYSNIGSKFNPPYPVESRGLPAWMQVRPADVQEELYVCVFVACACVRAGLHQGHTYTHIHPLPPFIPPSRTPHRSSLQARPVCRKSCAAWSEHCDANCRLADLGYDPIDTITAPSDAGPYKYTIHITDHTGSAGFGCLKLNDDCQALRPCLIASDLIVMGQCTADLAQCGPEACKFQFGVDHTKTFTNLNSTGTPINMNSVSVHIDAFPQDPACNGIGHVFPEFTVKSDNPTVASIDVSLIEYTKPAAPMPNFQQYSMVWQVGKTFATRACNLFEAKNPGVFPPTCTLCYKQT